MAVRESFYHYLMTQRKPTDAMKLNNLLIMHSLILPFLSSQQILMKYRNTWKKIRIIYHQ